MDSLAQIYEEELKKRWQATTNSHTKSKKIVLERSVWLQMTRNWRKDTSVYTYSNFHNRDKSVIEDAKARKLKSYFEEMLENHFVRENYAEITLDEIHEIFKRYLAYRGFRYTFFKCNTQNAILLLNLQYKYPKLYTYKLVTPIPDPKIIPNKKLAR